MRHSCLLLPFPQCHTGLQKGEKASETSMHVAKRCLGTRGLCRPNPNTALPPQRGCRRLREPHSPRVWKSLPEGKFFLPQPLSEGVCRKPEKEGRSPDTKVTTGMMPNDAIVCARQKFFLHLLLSEAFKGTRASLQQGYVLFDLWGCFK